MAAGRRPARARGRADLAPRRARRSCSCPRAPGSARWCATSCGAGTGCSSCGRSSRRWSAPGRGRRRGAAAPCWSVAGPRCGRRCPDLAAVVVLDEGDEALQEERVPTWHARDVVLERARRVGAAVTLVAPLPTPGGDGVDRRRGDPTRAPGRAQRLARTSRSSTSGPSRPAHGLLSDGAGARAAPHRRRRRARGVRAEPQGPGEAPHLPELLDRRDVRAVRRRGDRGRSRGCSRARAAGRPGRRSAPCATTRSCARRASASSACATRSRRCCPGPRSRGSTPRSTDVPDAPVVVGTEAVLHRVPGASSSRSSTWTRSCSRSACGPGSRPRGCWRVRRGSSAPATGAAGCSCRRTRPTIRSCSSRVDGDPDAGAAPPRSRGGAVLEFPPFGAVAEVSGEADAVRAALDALPAGGPRARPVGAGRPGSRRWRSRRDADALADALAVAAPAGRAEGRVRIAVDPPRV